MLYAHEVSSYRIDGSLYKEYLETISNNLEKYTIRKIDEQYKITDDCGDELLQISRTQSANKKTPFFDVWIGHVTIQEIDPSFFTYLYAKEIHKKCFDYINTRVKQKND